MSVIPSLSLSASNASTIPSSSESIPKQVKIMFPLKVELSVLLFNKWLKFNWLTLFATSLKGVVPFGVGLNLKRTSEAEKLLIPLSNISSKSVSIKRILLGSIRVIFFVFGPILRMKVSPLLMVWGIDVFWVN